MALENGYTMAAQALPTPRGTSYDTPSRSLSGRPTRQGSSSPFTNYPPALHPPGQELVSLEQQGRTETGEDERFDTRDPRRLTPNLGISFVSQIHTLKKELEGRDTIIGNLEEALHQAREENERLGEDLKAQRAEVKSVKYQMSSLERDMLQALEDIVKEKDSATETIVDARKHLEASKKKVHVLEQEASKTDLRWQQEKQEWEGDKRKLENKVHIVEERLKTMVAEVMAVHSMGENQPGMGYNADTGAREDEFTTGNDIRSPSRISNRSVDDTLGRTEAADFRKSRMSGLHEMGGSQMSALSLADELEMTEGDEDDVRDYSQNVYSPDALPEEINIVPRRYSEDTKARKVMGIHADNHGQPFGDENSGHQSSDIIQDYINLPGKLSSAAYTDRGTQCTPPPTVAAQTKQTDSVSEKPSEQNEHSANQSRKRVAIPSIFIEQTAMLKSELPKNVTMVSTSCQTEEPAQIPPPIDRMANEVSLPGCAAALEMRSTSTQTIEDITIGSKSASTRLSPTPLEVPLIAIHPPSSRPPSSHNSVVLPPRTRNAGCQVIIEMPKDLTSTAMQTEEIRIDKRPVKIPPRLQPSKVAAKSSFRPTDNQTRPIKTSLSGSSRHGGRSPPRFPAGNVKASTSGLTKRDPKNSVHRTIDQESRPRLPQSGHTHSEANDLAHFTDKHRQNQILSTKSEKVLAESVTAKEDDNFGLENDFSDDDESASAAPIRKTLSKVQNSWKLVPQPQNADLAKLESAYEESKGEETADIHIIPDWKSKALPEITSMSFQPGPTAKYRTPSSVAKPADIRRKALVSKGIAEHAQRARSPSLPSGSGKEAPAIPPPFPVPTRSSSRKIPISSSDGAASPTPHSTSFFTTRRGQNHGRPPIKRKILRKVQSAAAVPKAPDRRPPLPPPSISASSIVPGSLKAVPPPQTQFILPYDSVPGLPTNIIPAPQLRLRAGEASIEAPRQQTNVVDAIAQTMVGEWMWKYVRKRTSFGITVENPQAEFELGRNGESGNSSSVRHKRWVWLAPYQNAVIWSNKQPTSGPALLGKGGRKLKIQSVLDVKDDTPLPKNAGSQSAFDRSILILTPQRALKFTAVSRERHFIWLTALSFLSHSTRGMDDLASLPPLPQQEYRPRSSQDANASFRRTPARDSIRVAKDRSRPSLGPHSLSSPIGLVEQKIIQDSINSWGDREAASEDAAEPPQVPRVAAHARKRSSTGPWPVPLSAFHSYPTNGTAMASSFSLQAPTSRDKYDRFMPRSPGASASGPPPIQHTKPPHTTDPSRDSYIGPPPVVPDNFFDPAGTMRMEAFVRAGDENEPPIITQAEPVKARKGSRSFRTRQGRKKDLSYWGVAESAEGSTADSMRMKDQDPFTGF